MSLSGLTNDIMIGMNKGRQILDSVENAVGLITDLSSSLSKNHQYKPPARILRPNYNIHFLIGEVDLSLRVNNLVIMNNISFIFPCFFINILIDSKDYMLEKIYEHKDKDVVLRILLMDENLSPIEELNFSLLIMNMDAPLNSKINNNESSPQTENSIKITAVPKYPYNMMYTTVNKLFESNITLESTKDLFKPIINTLDAVSDIQENMQRVVGKMASIVNNGEDFLKMNVGMVAGSIMRGTSPKTAFGNMSENMFGNFANEMSSSMSGIGSSMNKLKNLKKPVKSKLPIDVIEYLYKKFIKGTNNQIVRENINDTELFQVQIPAMSFISAIKYLDDHYGIFNGPLFTQCRTEDNTFCLWDLSKAINNEPDYEVNFLALGQDAKKQYDDSYGSNSSFYTYNQLNTVSKGSLSVMKNGYKQLVITKPETSFYNILSTDMKKVAESSSPGSPEQELQIDASLKSNTSVNYKNVLGGNNTEAFLNSKLGKFISNSSMFYFDLSGHNIQLMKLLRVGGCILLNPYISEYIPFQGKYICNSSVISLSKSKSMKFDCNIRIVCSRLNVDDFVTDFPSTSKKISNTVETNGTSYKLKSGNSFVTELPSTARKISDTVENVGSAFKL